PSLGPLKGESGVVNTSNNISILLSFLLFSLPGRLLKVNGQALITGRVEIIASIYAGDDAGLLKPLLS
ncbi:MAG: hypothetical protein KUG83_03130, partial [Gammaproteobacteria bacterium]|nr:hypothetical protein [Gammaproteobacteria bacterium]